MDNFAEKDNEVNEVENVITDHPGEVCIADIPEKTSESPAPERISEPEVETTDQAVDEKAQYAAGTEDDIEKMVAKLPRSFPDAKHI